MKRANTRNKFFTSALKNLKNEKPSKNDPLARDITHPILKPVIKYRKNPSILAINNKNGRQRFDF